MDVSEFEPENLHEAWELLAGYIENRRKFAPSLQQKYRESFETWGLITQLYDAYQANTVQSELQKQIAAILSRAPMQQLFESDYNAGGHKIYLKDLLVYINRELEMSLQTGMTATGGSDRVVYVSMEKVDPGGLTKTTG